MTLECQLSRQQSPSVSEFENGNDVDIASVFQSDQDLNFEIENSMLGWLGSDEIERDIRIGKDIELLDFDSSSNCTFSELPKLCPEQPLSSAIASSGGHQEYTEPAMSDLITADLYVHPQQKRGYNWNISYCSLQLANVGILGYCSETSYSSTAFKPWHLSNIHVTILHGLVTRAPIRQLKSACVPPCMLLQLP